MHRAVGKIGEVKWPLASIQKREKPDISAVSEANGSLRVESRVTEQKAKEHVPPVSLGC